jgi:hypothetical protein
MTTASRASWRTHGNVAAAVDVLDFTDGNFRTVLGATWFERLITGPVFKLDVTAGLYASANMLDHGQRALQPARVLHDLPPHETPCRVLPRALNKTAHLVATRSVKRFPP